MPALVVGVAVPLTALYFASRKLQPPSQPPSPLPLLSCSPHPPVQLKHGSNVAGLQTEATLDVHTDEWIINTPDDGAIKWWIGNAAEDGKMATVFARLKASAVVARSLA